MSSGNSNPILRRLGVEGVGASGHFSSDSGGAGTLEPAVASFMERGIADEITLIANCSLHSLNLLLSVPWPKHHGDGGKDESNALQRHKIKTKQNPLTLTCTTTRFSFLCSLVLWCESFLLSSL